MSTSCLLLLARCCCTCALLLTCLSAPTEIFARTISPLRTSLVSTYQRLPSTKGNSTPVSGGGKNLPIVVAGSDWTDSPSSLTRRSNKDPLITDHAKGKCQYNLTQANIPVRVESVQFEHLGIRQCQYFIWAPAQKVILLNVSHIYSQTDMQVVDEGRHHNFHHRQQETTAGTLPTIDTISPNWDTPDNSKNTALGKDTSALRLSENLAHQSTSESSSSSSSPLLSQDRQKHLDSDPASSSSSPLYTSLPSLMSHDISSGKHVADHGKDSVRKSHPVKPIKNNFADNIKTSKLAEREGKKTPTLESGEDQQCFVKLIIEGTSGSVQSDKPQVICWHQTVPRLLPLVYHYSGPIRITFEWTGYSFGGFSLDYSLLRADDVECAFTCNEHLCLTTHQLCDGVHDCPDHSDELCPEADKHDQSKEASAEVSEGLPLSVVIVLVIVTLLLVIGFIVFMISRARHRRGSGHLLAPPHTHGSEVCCSTSGSAQESGQYDPSMTLLEDRYHHSHHSHYPLIQSEMMTNSRMSDREHLLQHHQSVESSSASGTGGRLCSLDLCGNRCSQQQAHQRLDTSKACQEPTVAEQFPPHVPISGDGEEGYVNSQRALIAKRQHQHNFSWLEEPNIFRPPPNKTVFDRDLSPPPYSAHSLDSLIPSVDVGRRSGQRAGQDSPPSLAPRSYSLSYHRHASIQPNHIVGQLNQPIPQVVLCGRRGADSISRADRCQPPPDYNSVVSNSDHQVTRQAYPLIPSAHLNTSAVRNLSGQAQRGSPPSGLQDKVLQHTATDSFKVAVNKSYNSQDTEANERSQVQCPTTSSTCAASGKAKTTTSCSETADCIANDSDHHLCVNARSSSPSSSVSSLSSNSSKPSVSRAVSVPSSSTVSPSSPSAHSLSSPSDCPQSAQQMTSSVSSRLAQCRGSPSQISQASSSLQPRDSSFTVQALEHIDMPTP